MGLQAIFSLKVFDYPLNVEVGDGLPGFPGLAILLKNLTTYVKVVL